MEDLKRNQEIAASLKLEAEALLQQQEEILKKREEVIEALNSIETRALLIKTVGNFQNLHLEYMKLITDFYIIAGALLGGLISFLLCYYTEMNWASFVVSGLTLSALTFLGRAKAESEKLRYSIIYYPHIEKMRLEIDEAERMDGK